MTVLATSPPEKRDRILDPEDTALSYEEWCEDNGFDPVTRTYRRDED